MTTTASDSGGTDVSIRPVERADLLDVVRIEKAAFPQPWPYQAFERFLDEPGFLVADRSSGHQVTTVDEFAIVGFVVADVDGNHGNDMGHVKDLAVHPDYRDRGIGSRLLERALSILATGGARGVKLEVRRGNDDARTLYERFGFESRHVVSGYYDDGEDALVLVRGLSDR